MCPLCLTQQQQLSFDDLKHHNEKAIKLYSFIRTSELENVILY